MSGALSGDPVDAYSPHVLVHGDPMMQGVSVPQTPFATVGPQFYTLSDETARKIASLQAKLDRKLGPEYISQRPGPGGGPKLVYVEGWKVINLANEVFGFNGWSSSVISLTTDFADYLEESKRYCIGVSAIVRVTLRDGVYHEDIGYGTIENTKSKGAGLDKCKKEAVTDGLKRALRNFGNLLGNCLYDKSYTAEVVKVKVEPPKFNTNELHRRPEFQDVKPKVITNPVMKPQARPLDAANNYSTPSRAPMQESRPKLQKPSNLRAEVQLSASTSAASTKGPQMPFKIPHPPAQPITPAATPMHNPQRGLQQDQRVSLNVTMPHPERASPPGSSKMPKDDVDFDSDDTFGLNDEEFLALADLVADTGRPIEQDDIGRPIHHEEPLPTTTHEAKKVETHELRQRPDIDAKKATRSMSRDEAIAAALEDNAATGKVNSKQITTTVPTLAVASTSRQPPPQTKPAGIVATAVATSSGSTSSGAIGAQQHRSLAQRLYHLREQNRNHGKHPTDHDQKHQNNDPISGTKIQSIPAMGGGFNFNSGINTIHSSTSSIPVIGIKRPAEAMSAGLGLAAQVRVPPTSFKGGRPGMGLQQAPPTPRHVAIGDREDVKRVKL